MGMIINTKFSNNEKAYVLSHAREEGEMVGGIIEVIIVKVGLDGTDIPSVWYKMTQTVAFVPPGGLWAEYELGTQAEAKAIADVYNRQLASEYQRRSE